MDDGQFDGHYAVGEVARLAGTTVRALHHYDRLGLVRPGGRSGAGHRRYSYEDLRRLQQVLAYRALGFGLDEIGDLLADAGTDLLEHLRRQRTLLAARIAHLQEVLKALDTTMEAHTMGIRLTAEELLEVFGKDDPAQYAEEVERRWGGTDAYAESRRRTATYSKDDWLRIRAEGRAAEDALLAALAAGEPPTSEQAMDAAEAHRAQIDRWFYPCPPAVHRGLADMYVADGRFTAHYDDRAAGLAAYVRDAVHANADRLEAAAG